MEGMDGLQVPEGPWSSQTSSGYNFETTSICSAEATSNLFPEVKKPLTEYVARWLVKDPQNLWYIPNSFASGKKRELTY